MDFSKQAVRKAMKLEFAKIIEEENRKRAEHLFEKIENTAYFKKAKHILAFWSLKDEPFTHDFCEKWCSFKNIYLPVINGELLEIKQFIHQLDLQPDKELGVLEPQKGTKVALELMDLILVPGLAFDKENNRLGRGKGFYDRFLPLSKALKIGVCYDFQLLEKVPSEAFDVKMDEVLSD